MLSRHEFLLFTLFAGNRHRVHSSTRCSRTIPPPLRVRYFDRNRRLTPKRNILPKTRGKKCDYPTNIYTRTVSVYKIDNNKYPFGSSDGHETPAARYCRTSHHNGRISLLDPMPSTCLLNIMTIVAKQETKHPSQYGK